MVKNLKECFTADEELGEAHVYQTDSKGQVLIDHERGELKTKVLKGRVVIIKPKDFIDEI